MWRARVVEAEGLAALRENGTPSVEQTTAVILEIDGSFSVVTQDDGPASALANVSGRGDGTSGESASD